MHVVASCLDNKSISSKKCFILLVDFFNAFNSVHRSVLFREVWEHTRGISAWMECSYRAQPLLHISDHTLYICCGVQQGDPLGFALALHPIVRRIQHQVPSLLINSYMYLDHGTLCGSRDDLAATLSIIIEAEGPARGLVLNWSKSPSC